MNKLITDNNGGFPLVLDDIRWNDNAYRAALNSLLRGFGDNFIVQGCIPTGTTTITISAGYVMLAGELVQVDSHVVTGGGYYQKVVTYNPAGSKTFRNASVVDTYQQNRAFATGAAGSLIYNGLKINDILITNTLAAAATDATAKANNAQTAAISAASTDAANKVSAEAAIRTNADSALQLNIDAKATIIQVDSINNTVAAQSVLRSSQNPQALITKVINLGDWDMFNNVYMNFTVAQLGISNVSKLRSFDALIISDTDSGGYYTRDLKSDGNIYANMTTNTLTLMNKASFQTYDFNATAYNRGYLKYSYIL